MSSGGDLAPCVQKMLDAWTGEWTLNSTQNSGGTKATWESQTVSYCSFAAWRFTITVDVSSAFAVAKLATPGFIREWDASCKHIEILDEAPHGNVMYSVKQPPLVSSRDSVVFATGCLLTPEEALKFKVARSPEEAGPKIDDFLTKTSQKDKPFRYVDRSTAPQAAANGLPFCFALGIEARDDPRRPNPCKPHVRATVHTAGFVSVPETPQRARISYLQCADPGGSFSPWIINGAGRFELSNIWVLKKKLEEAYKIDPSPPFPPPCPIPADDDDLASCDDFDITPDVCVTRAQHRVAPAGSPDGQRKELRTALLRAACGFAVAVAATRGSLSGLFSASTWLAVRDIVVMLFQTVMDILRRIHRPALAILGLAAAARDVGHAWRVRKQLSAPPPPPPPPPPMPLPAAEPRAQPPAADGESAGIPPMAQKLLEFNQGAGWTSVERSEVTWDQKETSHNASPAVRMSIEIDCPLRVAVAFMLNSDNMRRYEELLDRQERLVDERPQRTVMYACFKTPSSFVAPRDIVTEAQPCLLRPQEAVSFGVADSEAAAGGDAPFNRYGFDGDVKHCFVVGTRSVQHPSKPDQKGFTRAQSHCTGYIFSPAAGGKLRLTFVLDFDPMGDIPKFIVRNTLSLQKKKLNVMKRCLEEDARSAPPLPVAAPAGAAESPAEPSDVLPGFVKDVLDFHHAPGWTKVDRGAVDWDQKETTHNPTPAVRMAVDVDCPVRIAVGFMRDRSNLKRYEELLDQLEVLEEDPPRSVIQYASFRTPSSWVECRDLVTRAETCLLTTAEAARYGLGATTPADAPFSRYELSGNIQHAFVLGTRSVQDARRPARSGYTRAKSHCTGYIFAPTGENKLRLTFILDFDPSGNIPAFVTRNTLSLQKAKLLTMKKCLEEDARRAPPLPPPVPASPKVASPKVASPAAADKPSPDVVKSE